MLARAKLSLRTVRWFSDFIFLAKHGFRFRFVKEPARDRYLGITLFREKILTAQLKLEQLMRHKQRSKSHNTTTTTTKI